MSSITHIEKIESISYKDFINNYVKKRIPVVLKNASTLWKSNNIFTPDFFDKNFGKHEYVLENKTYTVSEILKITKTSTDENPAPYPLRFEIPIHLPDLLPYFEPLHMEYARPNWFRSKAVPYDKFGNNINLFFGGKGNRISLHKDLYHTNAWITQLYGDKKFIVYPGDQDSYLYAGKEGHQKFLSPIQLNNPDYEKYPDFRKAKSIEIVLNPGETIFVPNGVWHTTVANEQNISLIFDQLNRYNHKLWAQDLFDVTKKDNKIKAAVHFTYAHTVGIACRIAELFGEKF